MSWAATEKNRMVVSEKFNIIPSIISGVSSRGNVFEIRLGMVNCRETLWNGRVKFF